MFTCNRWWNYHKQFGTWKDLLLPMQCREPKRFQWLSIPNSSFCHYFKWVGLCQFYLTLWFNCYWQLVLGWWDICQESRRCSAAMKVKMDDILDKMISIRPDLHRSSFEVSGNDCTSNTKKRKPPTFKQLFSGNTKLHKNLRRYFFILIYFSLIS